MLLASALNHSTVTVERRVGDDVFHRWISSSAFVTRGPTPFAPHVALVPLFMSLAHPVTLPGSMYQFETDHDGGFVGDGALAENIFFGVEHSHAVDGPVAWSCGGIACKTKSGFGSISCVTDASGIGEAPVEHARTCINRKRREDFIKASPVQLRLRAARDGRSAAEGVATEAGVPRRRP